MGGDITKDIRKKFRKEAIIKAIKSSKGKAVIGIGLFLTIFLLATGIFTGFFVPVGTALAARTVVSATLDGGSSVTVATNVAISATVTVTNSGSDRNWQSTGWRIYAGAPGAVTCFNNTNHDHTGTYTETFDITAPSTLGTFNVDFIAYSNGSCSAGASATYTITNAVTVPLYSITKAGIAADDGIAGSVSWFRSERAQASDSQYASVSLDDNQVSHYLKLTGFDFSSIPDGVAISGVGIKIERYASSGPSGPHIADEAVSLVKGGTVGGDNKADTINKWGSAEATIDYGGQSDLWGQTWTPQEIKDVNTGVVLSVAHDSDSHGRTAYVNYISMTVYYTDSKSDQIISVTAHAPANAVYNSTFPVAAAASSGLTVDITTSGSCSGNGSDSATITMTSGAGVCTVHYNQAGDSSYNPAPEITEDTTAQPMNITVTADAQTKVYGDPDPALTYVSVPELFPGDSFSGSLDRDVGEDVGGYTITQGALTAGNDYTINYAGNSLIITQMPITITADSKAKNYGESDPALTYQVTSGSLARGDSFSGDLSRDAGEDVGDYAILQGTVALNSNYDLSYVGANLTIGTATINVTADAQTKVYGDPDPALTYASNPALNAGDTFSGSLERVAGEDVGNYAIAQGTLTAGPNYDINYTGDNLAITAKPITVTVDAGQTKVYGDPDPVLTYTSDPLVGGDTFIGDLVRDAGENVGTYAINQGTLSAGVNYTINFVPDDISITANPIIVTAVTDTKIYDGTTSSTGVPTITSGSLAGSDTATWTQSFDTKDAGTNKILIPAGIVDDGNGGANYSVNFVDDATGSITQAELIVDGITVSDKVYDSTDSATPDTAGAILSGVVPGDDVSLDVSIATGTFNDGNVGIDKTVTIVGLVLAGADAGNYALTQPTVTASISVLSIIVTAVTDTKIYDGTTSSTGVPTITSGSLAGSDTATWTQSFDNESAGIGKTLIPSGTINDGNGGDNYDVIFVNDTTGAITAAQIITGGGVAGGGVYVPPEPTLTISDITSPNITTDSLTLIWTTNFAASSYVIYSAEGENHSLDMTDASGNPPTYGYAHATVEYDTDPKVMSHSVEITGLNPLTTYYFRTVSRGSLAISGEYKTTTPAVAGAQVAVAPPVAEVAGEIAAERASGVFPSIEQLPEIQPVSQSTIQAETIDQAEETQPVAVSQTSPNANAHEATAAASEATGASRYFWPILIIFMVICVGYVIYYLLRRRTPE